jgi:hypothetical protein
LARRIFGDPGHGEEQHGDLRDRPGGMTVR